MSSTVEAGLHAGGVEVGACCSEAVAGCSKTEGGDGPPPGPATVTASGAYASHPATGLPGTGGLASGPGGSGCSRPGTGGLTSGPGSCSGEGRPAPAPAIRFEVLDATAMACFAPDSFDIIVDKGCLDCFVSGEGQDRIHDYLRELARVLKPSGRLLLVPVNGGCKCGRIIITHVSI